MINHLVIIGSIAPSTNFETLIILRKVELCKA